MKSWNPGILLRPPSIAIIAASPATNIEKLSNADTAPGNGMSCNISIDSDTDNRTMLNPAEAANDRFQSN